MQHIIAIVSDTVIFASFKPQATHNIVHCVLKTKVATVMAVVEIVVVVNMLLYCIK